MIDLIDIHSWGQQTTYTNNGYEVLDYVIVTETSNCYMKKIYTSSGELYDQRIEKYYNDQWFL